MGKEIWVGGSGDAPEPRGDQGRRLAWASLTGRWRAGRRLGAGMCFAVVRRVYPRLSDLTTRGNLQMARKRVGLFCHPDPSPLLRGLRRGLLWRWPASISPSRFSCWSWASPRVGGKWLVGLHGCAAAAATVLGLILTGTACFLVFVWFPVQGPRYFGPPEGVPAGPVRTLVLGILERASSRGAAFPSAHMAFMTAKSALAFRFQRRMAWVLLVATLGVGAGAV